MPTKEPGEAPVVNHRTPRTKKATTTKAAHGASADKRRADNKAAARQKASRQGQARRDKPFNYGEVDRRPNLQVTPTFRFAAVRASGAIDRLTHVESVTWEDVNAILTGTMVLRDSAWDEGSAVKHLDQGDRVVCQVDEHDGRGFNELWFMRVYRPQLAVNDAQRTVQLVNDLDLLRQSDDNFLYKPDHAHVGGWTTTEIITDICKRYQVPIGAIALTTRKRAKFHLKRHSPLDAIRVQLRWELRHTRRRYVVRYEGGRLYILPLTRSTHLLGLGPTLIDAAFSSELAPEFASALLLHGLVEYTYGTTDKQGRAIKNTQKMHVYKVATAAVNRFGFVRKIMFSPDARTDAQLQSEAANYLAEVAKPLKKLTLTHAGIPRLRRGDAIKLGIGDDALRKQVVWVYEVSHSLTSSGYTMVVTVIFDDPYTDHIATKLKFRLKKTHDEAVGNRARLDPTGWMLPKNNKNDLHFQQSRQADLFNTDDSGLIGGPR